MVLRPVAAAAIALLVVQDAPKDKWVKLDPQKVQVEDGAWGNHPLLTFAGPKDGLDERAEAHRDKDEEALAKLPPLKAGEEAFYHLLWGWSGSGSDPLRATRVSGEFNAKQRKLRVIVTRKVVRDLSNAVGTCDMQYVGFRMPLGALPAADYAVEISEIVETFQTITDKNPTRSGKKVVRNETFKIPE